MIITSFFFTVANDERFHLLANKWMFMDSEYPRNKSALKIIENIIIGAIKKLNDFLLRYRYGEYNNLRSLSERR